MKAVRIDEHGGLDKLIYDDLPQPDCTPNKVKIHIKASALNHLDIWVRIGLPRLPVPLPIILGSDGSGIIVEVGANINNYHKGDDVVIQPGIFCKKCKHCSNRRENYCLEYGILGETENGTQAEYLVLDPINIHSMPNQLSYNDAASMPLVFMTAYQMLIKRAALQPNETVLVYGGTSGVGSAAIQICSDLGAEVIATAGNDDKCEYSVNMGAHHVVNHNQDNWLNEVKNITGKRGVDVVFEHIGFATWEQSQRILSKGGRIVTCGATTGSDVNINLAHLFMKQHTILGSTMASILAFKEVMEKIENGKYLPMVDKVIPMEDIRDAHEYLENRQQMGKVVVVP